MMGHLSSSLPLELMEFENERRIRSPTNIDVDAVESLISRIISLLDLPDQFSWGSDADLRDNDLLSSLVDLAQILELENGESVLRLCDDLPGSRCVGITGALLGLEPCGNKTTSDPSEIIADWIWFMMEIVIHGSPTSITHLHYERSDDLQPPPNGGEGKAGYRFDPSSCAASDAAATTPRAAHQASIDSGALSFADVLGRCLDALRRISRELDIPFATVLNDPTLLERLRATPLSMIDLFIFVQTSPSTSAMLLVPLIYLASTDSLIEHYLSGWGAGSCAADSRVSKEDRDLLLPAMCQTRKLFGKYIEAGGLDNLTLAQFFNQMVSVLPAHLSTLVSSQEKTDTDLAHVLFASIKYRLLIFCCPSAQRNFVGPALDCLAELLSIRRPSSPASFFAPEIRSLPSHCRSGIYMIATSSNVNRAWKRAAEQITSDLESFSPLENEMQEGGNPSDTNDRFLDRLWACGMPVLSILRTLSEYKPKGVDHEMIDV